jgi:hypothetical protein
MTTEDNPDAFAPPLYYFVAGAWYRAGAAIGLHDFRLLYWTRFLNAGLYALLVALTWQFCARFLPDRPEIGWGAAALLAVFPQDVVYAITSDALAPAAAMLAIYLLMDWGERQTPGRARAAAAGVATAAALLVKLSNVPVLAVAVWVIARRIWRSRRGTRTLGGAEIVVATLSVAVPVAAWAIYCHHQSGDFAGSAHKAADLGWTVLPLRAALHHPIFTAPGLLDFFGRLVPTFWRGELYWHAAPRRVAWVDAFYVAASVAALIAAAVAWFVRPAPALRRERPAAVALFLMLVCSVLFLAYISTRFDFGNCFFPSRGFPYFAAGRLMIGALGPFAILYTAGLAAIAPRDFRRAGFAVLLGATLLICVGVQAFLAPPVFASPHNFFHATVPAGAEP